MATAEAKRILRRRELETAYGLSRSGIYDLMQKGSFPKPISLGARSVGWLADEVEAWLATRVAARESKKTATK